MSKNNLRLDLCLPSILLMPSCNGKYRIRQKAWMPAFLLEKRQENDHYSKLNLKLNREQVAQLKLRTQLLGSSAESLHDDSLCKVRQMFADLLGQIHCILSRCLKNRNKTIRCYQQLQAETRSCSMSCNVMIKLAPAANGRQFLGLRKGRLSEAQQAASVNWSRAFGRGGHPSSS
jgi:hypothetical protein